MPRTGRPSIYSKALANRICKRIAEGESLIHICSEEGMPRKSTVLLWIIDGKHEEFSDQYARACNARAEIIFEELLDIADDSSNDTMLIEKGNGEMAVENREWTNRSRLRVDTRKWYLSKVLPKKFGEKLDVTSDGKAIKGNTIVFKDFNGTGGK